MGMWEKKVSEKHTNKVGQCHDELRLQNWNNRFTLYPNHFLLLLVAHFFQTRMGHFLYSTHQTSPEDWNTNQRVLKGTLTYMRHVLKDLWKDQTKCFLATHNGIRFMLRKLGIRCFLVMQQTHINQKKKINLRIK